MSQIPFSTEVLARVRVFKIMWVLYDGSFSDQTTEYIERLAYLHFLAFLSYIIQQMFWGFLSVKYNDSNGPKENRVEIICMPWWSSRVRSLWVRMSSSTHVVEKFACAIVWPEVLRRIEVRTKKLRRTRKWLCLQISEWCGNFSQTGQYWSATPIGLKSRLYLFPCLISLLPVFHSQNGNSKIIIGHLVMFMI